MTQPLGGGGQALPPVLELLQGDVDGIPTFWVPGGDRLSVALVFGVGVRDESLVARGINHLVEHLTLFGLDGRNLDFNGHVSPTCTAFTASGSVDEVQQVVDHVCRALRSLPVDRIGHERRVLRTEARSRGYSLGGLHLDHRFGPNGIGLVDAEELGLRWLDDGHLRAWIDTWYTAGNAALAVSGPDPRQLRLPLPPGSRPVRPPAPTELITRPTWSPAPGNVVALSTTSTRSVEWMVSSAVVASVAEHRLRQVDGRTYAVVQGSIPLDADRSAFYLGADCLDEEADAVREAMSTELSRLRTSGPTDDELRASVTPILRSYRDERAAMAAAYSAADDHLLGRPARSLPQVAAAVEAVSASDVARCVEAALGRLLWTVPFTAFVNDRRYADLPQWSDSAVEGTAYQRGTGQDTSRIDDRLRIGPDGVSVCRGERPITVRWADLRAACRYEDRCWTLYGADGFTITVRGRDWYRGGDAVADIGLLAPRSLVVDMGEPLSPGEADVDPPAPLAPGPSAAAWRSVAGAVEVPGTAPPPPPGAATSHQPPAVGNTRDSGTWGAVAIVWVFAGSISVWFLSGIGDGSGNRARLRIALLVLAGAAYATRVLLKR